MIVCVLADSCRAGAQEGASYLASLAQLEMQLYHCFFDRDTAALQQLLRDLAELWADELRPRVLQCASAAQLCALLQALRSSGSGAGAQWLARMAATAQERLVFVVQVTFCFRFDFRVSFLTRVGDAAGRAARRGRAGGARQ